MKKLLTVLLAGMLLILPVAAQTSDEAKEETDATEAWENLKATGKDALKKTEKFLKAAGQDIKEGVNNLTEVKCIGTWSYKGKNCTTIITVNDDGTMEIEQREGFLKSAYYKGTYTQVIHSLNFKITEKGDKGWVVKADEQKLNNDEWFISYAVQDDAKKMKFTTTDIPADSDGTDFSKGVIFTKK